jgi:uncharacterized integral membrane protein
MSKYDEGSDHEPDGRDSLAGESFSRQSPEERQPAQDPEPAHRDDEGFRHTRTSAAWVAIVIAVVFGVALIDFIAQNTRHVRIEFFWASGHIPVSVALLAAALLGAIVVVAVGVGRMAQLRLKIRRQRRGPKAKITDARTKHEHNDVARDKEN